MYSGGHWIDKRTYLPACPLNIIIVGHPPRETEKKCSYRHLIHYQHRRGAVVRSRTSSNSMEIGLVELPPPPQRRCRQVNVAADFLKAPSMPRLTQLKSSTGYYVVTGGCHVIVVQRYCTDHLEDAAGGADQSASCLSIISLVHTYK